MEEQTQTQEAVEQVEQQEPQQPPQIDIDDVANRIAEKLKPAQEPEKPQNFEELDWDERDKQIKSEVDQLKAANEQILAQQQAFMKAQATEDAILSRIDPSLRESARATVKASIAELISTGNARAVAAGLPDGILDDIAGIAEYRARKSSPSKEPKGQPAANDIPHYDEIKKAIEASGRVATHAEIERRSKTWSQFNAR